MFSDSSVISDLSDLRAGVSLAVLDLTPPRASVVHLLNQAHTPVTGGYCLKIKGIFLNTNNAGAAEARFCAFEA